MYKLILADNQDVFRAGMAKLLGIEEDFRIIAQCREAERLSSAIESFPDAIVIFASSLKPDRQTVVPQVVATAKATMVITEGEESVQPWFALGVGGAAPRSVSGSALIECLRSVANGRRQVRAGGQGPAFQHDAVGSSVRNRLTPKELKILALLMQGGRNKDIAERLNTTEQVIKNYLRNIYDKTGVSDRLELALFTIHHRSLAEAAETVGHQLMESANAARYQLA